jgi:hypothetical protein
MFAASVTLPFAQRPKQRQLDRLMKPGAGAITGGVRLDLHSRHLPVDDALAARMALAQRRRGGDVAALSQAMVRRRAVLGPGPSRLRRPRPGPTQPAASRGAQRPSVGGRLVAAVAAVAHPADASDRDLELDRAGVLEGEAERQGLALDQLFAKTA